MKPINRYPGVQPFQKEQANLFFGRDEEIDRLFDLILLERLVVLFGKSGYGKSSLLNAGILPRLDAESARGKRRYCPVQVRFNAFGGQDSLMQKFIFHAAQALESHRPEPIKFIQGVPETLWSQLKFANLGATATIVLIFDQFEEFFSYPDEQQQDFKRQLAELLYADIPAYLKQNEEQHTPTEIAFLREKMDVKAVLSIRADRMSDLDRLKDKLPAILHKRCELRALTHAQARAALVEPAALPAMNTATAFASVPFAWSDAALERILGEFSRNKQGREVGVEAFLLQVLAQNVEQQVMQGRIAKLNGNGQPEVSVEDLPADLSNIFSEYYRNRIDDLPDAQRPLARKLIEEGLVFAGDQGDVRRLSIDGDLLMRQFGLPLDLLRALEDTFLLRREVNTTGGWNYELSHDILLKPILSEAASRQKKLQDLRRRLAWGVAGVAVVGLLVWFSLMAKSVSAEQEKEALQQQLDSIQLAQNRENEVRTAVHGYFDCVAKKDTACISAFCADTMEHYYQAKHLPASQRAKLEQQYFKQHPMAGDMPGNKEITVERKGVRFEVIVSTKFNYDKGDTVPVIYQIEVDSLMKLVSLKSYTPQN